MPKTRKLSLTELGEATGYSRTQLNRFLKMGLPHSKKRVKAGGKPRIMTDLEEAVTWLSAKGIVTPTAKDKAVEEVGRRIASQLTAPPKDEAAPGNADRPQIDQRLLNQLGIVGALERLKLQEFNSSRLMLRLIHQSAGRDEINGAERLHTKTCIAMRQAEFAVLEYRKRHGELVEFGPMVVAWEHIATGFKTAVEGIPSSSIQRIRHFLKDPENDTESVYEVLAAECRIALSSLPDEIPRGSDKASNSGGNPESAT